MTEKQLHRMYHLMALEFLTPYEDTELDTLIRMYHDEQQKEFTND